MARHARRTREQTRRILGSAENQKAYLVSFQLLDPETEAKRRLETMGERG